MFSWASAVPFLDWRRNDGDSRTVTNFVPGPMQEVLQKIFASGLWGCGFGGGSAFARRGLELLIYAAAAPPPSRST